MRLIERPADSRIGEACLEQAQEEISQVKKKIKKTRATPHPQNSHPLNFLPKNERSQVERDRRALPFQRFPKKASSLCFVGGLDSPAFYTEGA